MRENSVLAKSAKEAKAKGGFAGLMTGLQRVLPDGHSAREAMMASAMGVNGRGAGQCQSRALVDPRQR